MLVVITISLSRRAGDVRAHGRGDRQGPLGSHPRALRRAWRGLRHVTLLVANSLITISEFAGIAAAFELFGIPKYITVPLAALGIWLVITRGSYERVEKIFLAMSLRLLHLSHRRDPGASQLG